jgi:hypothetical protein
VAPRYDLRHPEAKGAISITAFRCASSGWVPSARPARCLRVGVPPQEEADPGCAGHAGGRARSESNPLLLLRGSLFPHGGRWGGWMEGVRSCSAGWEDGFLRRGGGRGDPESLWSESCGFSSTVRSWVGPPVRRVLESRGDFGAGDHRERAARVRGSARRSEVQHHSRGGRLVAACEPSPPSRPGFPSEPPPMPPAPPAPSKRKVFMVSQSSRSAPAAPRTKMPK